MISTQPTAKFPAIFEHFKASPSTKNKPYAQ